MSGRSEVDAVSDGCGSDEEEEEEEKNRRHEAVPHVPGFVSLIIDYRLLISLTLQLSESFAFWLLRLCVKANIVRVGAVAASVCRRSSVRRQCNRVKQV